MVGTVDSERAVDVACETYKENISHCLPGGSPHMTSSLLGIHVREGREQVATVSPTRTRWVSQE